MEISKCQAHSRRFRLAGSFLAAMSLFAVVSPATARTLRVRLLTRLELPTRAPIIVAQNSPAEIPAVGSSDAASPASPSQLTPAARNDGAEPLSERAAAAAARAARALADEDDGPFDGAAATETEIIAAPSPQPTGQPVTASNQRRTTAAMLPKTSVANPVQPSKATTTCLAGCN